MAHRSHRAHRGGAGRAEGADVRPGFLVEAGRVVFSGDLVVDEAAPLWRGLRELVRRGPRSRLDLDLSGAGRVDGAMLALLVALRAELWAAGRPSELVGVPEGLAPLVRLHGGDAPPVAPRPPPRPSALAWLGAEVAAGAGAVSRAFAFVGGLVAALGGVLVRPGTANVRAVPELAARAGADGVPIVLLLNFLVGVVMAYQSSEQLRLYGANVFVADVVGISLTRELSPLMTAIIVSGRSGASYAAELGAMKVSEEIDALRTMGLEPFRFLALPRILALVLVTPVLALLGDVIGVTGGAVVGALHLEVGPRAYLAELRTAVFARDVLGGLGKSVAFGLAIGVIGCHHGFATSGGAAGVGRRTTATVVTCLFAIVVIDTIFTMVYRVLGV